MLESGLSPAYPGGIHRGEARWAHPQATLQQCPNRFVRAVLCLTLFAIPFASLYLPGTGDRLGVIRFSQVLVGLAMITQPAVCLRRWPLALSCFVGYCAIRVAWGLWLTPQLASIWWPSTFGLLQYSLPWVLFLSNVLRFPGMARLGLWAFVLGAATCATLHILGIGTLALNRGLEGRSTVFGENANVVGINYAMAGVALVGLLLSNVTKPWQRLATALLILVIGLGLAMTGSRTAAIVFLLGPLVLLCFRRSPGGKLKEILLVLAMVGLVGGILLRVPTVLNRLEEFHSKNPREEPRARMFPVLWEIFLRNPILGSGPDDYQEELTQRALPYLMKRHSTISSHNLVLLLLVETGLLGFAAFVMGLGVTFAAAWQARALGGSALPLAMLLPFPLIGILSSDPHYDLVFWFAIAFALASPNMRSTTIP